jgi:hypothetical protein
MPAFSSVILLPYTAARGCSTPQEHRARHRVSNRTFIRRAPAVQEVDMRSAQGLHRGLHPGLHQELHPEFGYFWPSLALRRHARLGLIGAAIGAAFAAGTLVILTAKPEAEREIGLVSSADAAVPDEAVTHSAGAARAVKPCEQQTWPYIENKCLPRSGAQPGAQRSVRVLPPDAPPQTDLVANAGANAHAAKTKRTQTTASSDKQRVQDRVQDKAQDSRTRQRSRDAEDVPERAYATPQPSRRIQPQRREWHWSW